MVIVPTYIDVVVFLCFGCGCLSVWVFSGPFNLPLGRGPRARQVIPRNMLIALTPILPDALTQVVIIIGVMLLSLDVIVRIMPWRVDKVNYLDASITMVLICAARKC